MKCCDLLNTATLAPTIHAFLKLVYNFIVTGERSVGRSRNRGTHEEVTNQKMAHTVLFKQTWVYQAVFIKS
jgi:hypothetical protein